MKPTNLTLVPRGLSVEGNTRPMDLTARDALLMRGLQLGPPCGTEAGLDYIVASRRLIANLLASFTAGERPSVHLIMAVSRLIPKWWPDQSPVPADAVAHLLYPPIAWAVDHMIADLEKVIERYEEGLVSRSDVCKAIVLYQHACRFSKLLAAALDLPPPRDAATNIPQPSWAEVMRAEAQFYVALFTYRPSILAPGLILPVPIFDFPESAAMPAGGRTAS